MAYLLGGGGGTDWSLYDNIEMYGLYTPVGTAFETLLDITGEGFLDLALITNLSGGTVALKITIDGVVYYNVSGAAYPIGVCKTSDISVGNSDTTSPYPKAFPIGFYVYNDTFESRKVNTLASSIGKRFLTSLKIEVSQSATQPFPYSYSYLLKD